MSSRPAHADAAYVIRRWRGLWRLVLVVTAVLVVGFALGLSRDRMVVNLVTLAIVLVLAVRGVGPATTVLRVDAYGVTWTEASTRQVQSRTQTRSLPWSSIDEVEVADGAAVRARLSPDASLPAFLGGWLDEPGRPTVVEAPAPGVSAVRLREVAARNAPNVRIVATV